MINVSIRLIGGDLDGQTYTAKNGETSVRIYGSDKKDNIISGNVSAEMAKTPEGKWYIYEQESEGSDRFVFKHTE